MRYQTSIVDLTELAEQALRESETLLSALMKQLPVGLGVMDINGHWIISNAIMNQFLPDGMPSVISERENRWRAYDEHGKRIPPENSPGQRALRGEVVDGREMIFTDDDGRDRWIWVSAAPLLNEAGAIIGATAILQDITERKHTEAAAMRLGAIVQSSHDAVVAKDLNGIITDWNKSAERIFGYKPKQIIGKSILTLIPKERQSEEKEILRKIRRGESIDHYETVRRRRDGRLIDVSLTISPIKSSEGKIIGVSKIARDVTEQKLTERRLAEQARLLDLTNEAILVRDTRDRITYWNRGAEELYGYLREHALGKVTHKLLQTEHSEPLEQLYKTLEHDGRWNGELVHRHKDGEKIVVMSHWALDCDEFGRRRYVLETNTDITQRKRAEVALLRSKELLQQLVQQRTKALQAANAELKNEIGRRKGLEGEILSVSDREQQRLGQELHDGLCQHLTAVAFMARSMALRLRNHRVIDAADIEKIAELVNNAAIDTRSLSRALHRMDVDSATLVTALQDLVDREIWKTSCRLEVKPSFRINDDAAAAHLYRIAREAVINANKHAHARQIVVRLERVRQEMALRVIDDGIGFPKNLRPQQGLGYHIMNYRAQLMGGRLEIDSPQTGGTRVSCYLPVHAPRSNKAPNGDEPIESHAKRSSVPVAHDRTLRHLTRQGAANA